MDVVMTLSNACKIEIKDQSLSYNMDIELPQSFYQNRSYESGKENKDNQYKTLKSNQ